MRCGRFWRSASGCTRGEIHVRKWKAKRSTPLAGTVGRRHSEKRARSFGGKRRAAAPRSAARGSRAWPAPAWTRCTHDVEPERRRCPACGDEYGAHGSEDSEQLEIEVRAYRRVIKRRRYRRSCQCAAAPRLLTAPAPARLIPKGILGISVWVTVLIDKYLLYRPTYRLWRICARMGWILPKAPSPTVVSGTVFALGMIERSRTAAHWHGRDPLRYSMPALVCGCSGVPKPDPFGAGAEAAFRDRDVSVPLLIVQTVGQGHRSGAVVLLGTHAA